MKRCFPLAVVLSLAVCGCHPSTNGVDWREHGQLTEEHRVRLESMLEEGAADVGEASDETGAGGALTVPSFEDVSFETGVYDLVAAWGLSWTDIENDGDPDLFVSNHMHYPSALYVNEGGIFLRRSRMPLEREIGLDDHVGVWGDYDGDSDLDLYTANGFYREDRLMRNEGSGSFFEATRGAGVTLGEQGRGRSALWSDLDGDGWLDLLVFNLTSPDLSYRNNGDGTFRELGRDAGLRNSFLKDGAVVGDLDGDGDQDVYLLLMRKRQKNLLFLNRGDGVFVERSAGSGSDIDGASRAGAIGDIDNDGDLDLYVVREDPRGDVLLRNRGDATFEDVTESGGVRIVERGVRNAGFADFDNDGNLDLYISNGGLYDENNVSNVLLLNRGDGTFEDRTASSGAAGPDIGSSASAAFADYNGDGFLDIALTNGGGAVDISGPTQLLRNRGSADPASSRWLAIHPRRLSGSRSGQGAVVSVLRPDGGRLSRISGKARVMAQDAPGAHFGLGAAEYVSEVQVSWPDGMWQRLQSVPADITVEAPAVAEVVALESHPAALLGRVTSIDHEAVRRRIERLYSGRPLPAASPSEVARRREAVLAYALASDLAAGVEVDDGDLENAYRDLETELRLPPRVWIDQVAVGKFTTFKQRPAPHPEVAEAVLADLRAGVDAHEVALRSRVRAWARLYQVDEVSKPIYGGVDTSHRGYVESGWLTAEMAWERYGDLAEVLVSADEGDVLGPFELREGRDVQPFNRVWPMIRVFKVGERQRARSVRLDRVATGLRRRAAERELLAAIEAAGGASDKKTGSGESTCGWIGGSRYDIRSLAGRAKALGLDGREDVSRALELAEEEAHLNRAILDHLDDLRISEERIAEYVEDRRAVWTVPKRVRGTVFFFADGVMAEETHRRLVAGVLVTELASEIPALSHPKARANVAYSDEIEFGPARAERLFGQENSNKVFEIEPGGFSEVLTVGDEHYILSVEAQVAAEPLDQEWARRTAIRELMQAEQQRVLDTILGWR